ncbi:hypothetical protein [Parafrankia elaeagni]|uniref:hypothetical protein n=1 Tax=Parafrankia elaeagni TaxID=222534 RepID=UPI00037AE834|nr:hypothetical protein [Parafrankia elaeagni]
MIATALPALRAGLCMMAALLAVVLAVAGAVRGAAGAAGAALAVGLVAAFFALGKLALVAVARRGATTMLLPAALGVYAAKVCVLGVVLLALRDVTAIDLQSFAWSIMAATLCWVGAEVWVAARLRVPFYDPATFDPARVAPLLADRGDPPGAPRGATNVPSTSPAAPSTRPSQAGRPGQSGQIGPADHQTDHQTDQANGTSRQGQAGPPAVAGEQPQVL